MAGSALGSRLVRKVMCVEHRGFRLREGRERNKEKEGDRRRVKPKNLGPSYSPGRILIIGIIRR